MSSAEGGVIRGFTLMGDPKGGGEDPSRPSRLQRRSSEKTKGRVVWFEDDVKRLRKSFD